jgi:hypothetical protein
VTPPIEKICKLRRLSQNNPDEHEAAKARKKVDELLERHGLTEADLDRHERPRPQPMPVPVHPGPFSGFPGGVTIYIVPGHGFGSVFGFGHGFGFGPSSTDTGTSSQTDGWA